MKDEYVIVDRETREVVDGPFVKIETAKVFMHTYWDEKTHEIVTRHAP